MTAQNGTSAPPVADLFELEDKVETQKAENKILRQKLQSKAEALIILSKELDKIRSEADEYRDLTQRLQSKYSALKTGFSGLPFRVDRSVAKQFGDLRDENKLLVQERDELRRRLGEKEGDVKVLREQLIRERNPEQSTRNGGVSEDLVAKLEKLQIKYQSLRQDLQSLLDEKEDLVQERDAYKCKVHRLNHALTALLKSDGFKAIDLDCLLAENRYLQESLIHAREEKQLANEMGRRYKAALERNKLAGGGQVSGAGVSDQTKTEIRRLLAETAFPCGMLGGTIALDNPGAMQELCLSLLETLSDRLLQLRHQRRANKHLMAKMSDLETKLLDLDNGEIVLWPSQFLMKDYNVADVDAIDVEGNLNELDDKLSQLSSTSSSSMRKLSSDESASGVSASGVGASPSIRMRQRSGEAADASDGRPPVDAPDVQELYKKFHALSVAAAASHCSAVEQVNPKMNSKPVNPNADQEPVDPKSTLKPVNPPDIIVDGIPRVTKDDSEDIEELVSITSFGLELSPMKQQPMMVQPMVEEEEAPLPEHLRDMVSSAMKEMES